MEGTDIHLVSAYGPQVGFDEATKREFKEEFDSLFLSISRQTKECLTVVGSQWPCWERQLVGGPEPRKVNPN